MLIRWPILVLCRSTTEIRVVLRAVRHRRQDDSARLTTQDRRVARNPRLALLWAVLVVQIENPQLFALGVLMVPGVGALWLLRAVGVLR